MSHSIASQVRLEISICLDNLGHDNEANYERRLAFACLDKPPRDALGWLVQGRLFDAEHRHADAIGSYETVFKMPFFERKMVQRDTSFQLAVANFKAGRPHEAIRWAEWCLQCDTTRSRRYFLHKIAGSACSILGRVHEQRQHEREVLDLAIEEREINWISLGDLDLVRPVFT